MEETGDVLLGKRTLLVDGQEEIEIRIFVPVCEEDGNYRCCFSREGLIWDGRLRKAYGVDAIQALYGALQSVGSDLHEVKATMGRRVEWLGSEDLGLPKLDV